MKKYIALTVALTLTTLAVHAQTSGNITIAGTVANETTITVASQAGYNSLLIAAGTVDQLVANVTEKSNDRIGYTVTLNSLNAGSTAQAFLGGAAVGNTDTVNYTLKYNGTAVTLVSGSAVVTTSATRTPQAGVVKGLAVTIPATWVNTDTYSDTLTLTIAAL